MPVQEVHVSGVMIQEKALEINGRFKLNLSAAWRQPLDDEAVEWVMEEGPPGDVADDHRIQQFIYQSDKKSRIG